jgi:type III pantothenate kinase
VFRGGEIAQRWRIVSDDHADAIGSVLDAASPDAVVFSSVVPGWGDTLTRLCSAGVKVLEAGTWLTLPFKLLVDEPDKLGPDRLAAACGARALDLDEAVIVDCGTAITVDVLNAEGFCGGAIFPGYELILGALERGTAALPGIEPAFDACALPGRSTRDAMLAGAVIGTAGAVKEMIRRSFSSFSCEPPVLVTGGGADTLEKELGLEFRSEPDLLFLGLHLLHELNAGSL